MWNLHHFEKKDESRSLIISEIIVSDMRLLLKRLESLASEHHSDIKVLTGPKHRWKEQSTTFILFSNEFQVNWVGKSLIYSDLKS